MLTPDEILAERRRIWASKEILKRLYEKWYRFFIHGMRPGKTLELGGGSGNLKEIISDVISTDVVFVPWLDAVIDAHDLPFKDGSLSNILLFDVLHHLSNPVGFFKEAERVLKPKGRILLIEPFVSLVSFFIYQFGHSEGMNWRTNPFKDRCSKDKNPLQGNQAIPSLMLSKYRNQFLDKFCHLEIVYFKRSDFFIYPLSGGFHQRTHPT